MYRSKKIAFLLLACAYAGFGTMLHASEEEKPEVKIGGALRFSYSYSDWQDNTEKRGGDFVYDVFRLNVNAKYKNISLHTDARYYADSFGGFMLKYGYASFHIDDQQRVDVGLVPVPFGIKPYTANNFYFNLPYYIGLEDDADTGIGYSYTGSHWAFRGVFFKNSDLQSSGDKSEISGARYGYDVAGANRETNTINLQGLYRWGTKTKQELGLSLQYGGLYNLDTEDMGHQTAVALHYTAQYKRWHLMTEYFYYKMDPKNAEGTSNDYITMTAFNGPYHVATEGQGLTACLSYAIPVKSKFLSEIKVYNDFSMLDKLKDGYKDSYQNVLGCQLTMGPIYTYVDYLIAKRHAWLGGDWTDSFAQGGDNGDWNTRLNINIGYYF